MHKKILHILQNWFSWAKQFLLRVLHIDDSPQKIALGFALGIFLGIMPGVGPLASLTLAMVFRLNRVSAVLGSMLTNTWITIVAWALAVHIGCFLLGMDVTRVCTRWRSLFTHFTWNGLGEAWSEIIPVLIGYMMVSAVLAVTGYLVVLVSVLFVQKRKKEALLNKK